MFRLFFITLVSLMVASILTPKSYANEAPPAEAKAEGGAEGKKEDAKKGAEEEWPKVQSEVQVLQAKVRQSEELIKKLSEDKQKAPDDASKAAIAQQMVAEYKILQQSLKDYEIKRNYLIYRFPEKGRKDARKYQRIELKPLEEMENQHTLESRINNVMRKVRKQYGEEPKEQGAGGKPGDSAEKKKLKDMDLTEPVILSK